MQKEQLVNGFSEIEGHFERKFRGWNKLIVLNGIDCLSGHADGMVRAIGDYYILMNNYCDFDKDLQKRLRAALSGRFSIAELHYEVPRPSRLSWAYLNFLQVNNCIFVPGLGVREDEKALEQIQEYYPHHKVILVSGCQELVKEGGALNCISWNIVSNKKITAL